MDDRLEKWTKGWRRGRKGGDRRRELKCGYWKKKCGDVFWTLLKYHPYFLLRLHLYITFTPFNSFCKPKIILSMIVFIKTCLNVKFKI